MAGAPKPHDRRSGKDRRVSPERHFGLNTRMCPDRRRRGERRIQAPRRIATLSYVPERRQGKRGRSSDA